MGRLGPAEQNPRSNPDSNPGPSRLISGRSWGAPGRGSDAYLGDAPTLWGPRAEPCRKHLRGVGGSVGPGGSDPGGPPWGSQLHAGRGTAQRGCGQGWAQCRLWLPRSAWSPRHAGCVLGPGLGVLAPLPWVAGGSAQPGCSALGPGSPLPPQGFAAHLGGPWQPPAAWGLPEGSVPPSAPLEPESLSIGVPLLQSRHPTSGPLAASLSH